jgi:hypothetical protein
MLERIRDSRLEQLKMDISYSNLLNKKKTEKRKFDTSSGITFSGLKSTNGFTFGFKPNSANAKYVMNHFMKS